MVSFMSTLVNRCVGIDISSKKLDASANVILKKKGFKNNASGITRLLEELDRIKPDLIVVEATGGYEKALVDSLHKHGLVVAMVDPRRVRDFARACGLLAKTDAIDACVLVNYGLKMCPEPTPKPDPNVEEIDELRTRHSQLTDILVAEKNRLKTAPERMKEGIRNHIRWLDKELNDLEGQIKKAIDKVPALKNVSQIMQSIPGVGPGTTAAVIGGLPELGNLDHRKIAALVGVAPHPHDSGTLKGKRYIRGGRASVRSALYMAAMSAIQHNSLIKGYYQRLLAAGKEKKVALIACVHKLLIILNAMVREQKKWCPDPSGA